MDHIGRLGDRIYNGVNDDGSECVALMAAAKAMAGGPNQSKMFVEPDLKFSPIDSSREELSNTDNYSFMKRNVPSLLLSSGGFDEHHTTQDKIALIDFGHLQKASQLLLFLLKTLAN